MIEIFRIATSGVWQFVAVYLIIYTIAYTVVTVINNILKTIMHNNLKRKEDEKNN